MNNHANKLYRRQISVADPKIGRPSFLTSTARTLREACCGTGLDRDGRRCAYCPVAGLCADESRWLVRSARWTN